jgi:HPt (histidine-containing phosphotransfer) domain-containing protein
MSEDRTDIPQLLGNLREIAGDDWDFIREIVDLFLREIPRKVEDLGAAIEHGDVPGVADVAHSLKGSALAVDAEVLRGLSEAIEHTARAGSLNDAAGRYSALQLEVQRIKPIFEDLAFSEARGD